MIKNGIKTIIAILTVILFVMVYLIYGDYKKEKKVNIATISDETKDWKINKYDGYYELYINDNNKKDNSKIYLLDKNNNLIYTFSDYKKDNHSYIALRDISSTAKVIVTSNKISYNKDISSSIKSIGETTTHQTTTTGTPTVSSYNMIFKTGE